MMQITDFCRTMVETYGINTQIDIAIEEMAELIQALMHYRRKRSSNSHHITEEMADVLICIEQLKYIFDISNDQLTDTMERKMLRIESTGVPQWIIDPTRNSGSSR